MGRIKKQRAERDARRQPGARPAVAPPFPQTEMERILRAWDRAVDTGLMEGGTETKYHFTPDGKALSVAVGKSGQVLANGERLTPSVAERLRTEMPLWPEWSRSTRTTSSPAAAWTVRQRTA